MRVCVAGGGLAGTLLAWRLAFLPDVWVDLMTWPFGADSGGSGLPGLQASEPGCTGGPPRMAACCSACRPPNATCPRRQPR